MWQAAILNPRVDLQLLFVCLNEYDTATSIGFGKSCDDAGAGAGTSYRGPHIAADLLSGRNKSTGAEELEMIGIVRQNDVTPECFDSLKSYGLATKIENRIGDLDKSILGTKEHKAFPVCQTNHDHFLPMRYFVRDLCAGSRRSELHVGKEWLAVGQHCHLPRLPVGADFEVLVADDDRAFLSHKNPRKEHSRNACKQQNQSSLHGPSPSTEKSRDRKMRRKEYGRKENE